MFPHSFFPEYFAAGAEPWLMEALTHPQMAALQEALHGGGPVRLDHNVMLNRKPGSQGRTWHSHPYDARDSETLDTTGAAAFASSAPSPSPTASDPRTAASWESSRELITTRTLGTGLASTVTRACGRAG